MQSPDVTALLRAWSGGDASARDRLLPLVYRDLRQCAANCLRRERRDHTLQPTALVNEAYLRLIRQRRPNWQSRAHFLAISAVLMRRVLVDHARQARMAKRAGRQMRVTLAEDIAQTGAVDVRILDLDRALGELAAFDPRRGQIAELRFFGGMSLAEVAHVTGLSVATIERDWQAARAWLFNTLNGGPRS